MRFLRGGEKARGPCESCKAFVAAHYERRTIQVERAGKGSGKVDVPDVLVMVCDTCGSIVAYPAQSTFRVKESRTGPAPKCEVRIPAVLDDALGVIALEHNARVDDFGPAAIRYYLRRLDDDDATAAKVKACAASPLASGKADGRISLRLDKDTWRASLAAAAEVGMESWSEIIRGAIVLLAVDAGVTTVEGVKPSRDARKALATIGMAVGEPRRSLLGTEGVEGETVAVEPGASVEAGVSMG